MRRNSKCKKQDTKKRFGSKTKSTTQAVQAKPDDYISEKDLKDQANNDFAWYNRIPALTEPVAHISWINTAGRAVPWGETVTGEILFPGIAVLGLTPSFGWSGDGTSPVNIAAQKIQLHLQRTVSGTLPFDAPDTMLYCMAMSQVYSFLNFMERIYGTVNMYSSQNRYMPEALLSVQGINAAEIRSNMALFRFRIQSYISKLSSMPMPNVFTILNREAFLYQNYYIEGTSPKDQMYMYAPDNFFQFNEKTETGGSLQILPYSRVTQRTLAQLCSYMDSLIDPLINSSQMSLIGGTIARAFGTDQLVRLDPIPVDYVMQPIFNIGVLEQMKNATLIYQAMIDLDGFGWVQDPTTNFLYHDGQLTANTVGQKALMLILAANRLITTSTEYTDEALAMESTRLMATAMVNSNGVSAKLYTAADMLTSVNVYTIQQSSTATSGYTTKLYDIVLGFNLTNNAMASVTVELMAMHSHFKFLPLSYLYTVTGTEVATATATINDILMDVDNYAVISPDELINMHDAALQNLFYSEFITQGWVGK